MKTIEEAKECWCPMARVGLVVEEDGHIQLEQIRSGVNRLYDGKTKELKELECADKCEASRCMMWRWSGKDKHHRTGVGSERQGYCGLAHGE